jgi:H+/gluconate symporter-like permease
MNKERIMFWVAYWAYHAFIALMLVLLAAAVVRGVFEAMAAFDGGSTSRVLGNAGITVLGLGGMFTVLYAAKRIHPLRGMKRP